MAFSWHLPSAHLPGVPSLDARFQASPRLRMCICSALVHSPDCPRKMAAFVRSDVACPMDSPPPSPDGAGGGADGAGGAALGKVVAEFVGAFNDLTERMRSTAISTYSTLLLLRCLKLSISLLRALPPAPNGRPPLTRALSVACTLSDLQVDAEIISACIMRVVLEARATSLLDVKRHVGVGTAHLLHECSRIRKLSSKVEELDYESASALRKLCLSYYDIRAVVLELAERLDRIRHLSYHSRYH